MFKLLPMRYIFFDLVSGLSQIGSMLFCISYVRLSAYNIILIYLIKIDHVQLKWSWLTVVELSIDHVQL